jgi:hypothetical protein
VIIERSIIRRSWSRFLLLAILLPGPLSAAPSDAAPKGAALAAADAALAGHYYLYGVTEVGSELLLKPDGTFEWMLAYGAVDQAAHGTWKREAGEVVLTADKRDPSAPIFTLGPLQPWDDDAEQRLQDMIFTENQAQIEKLCPFLLVGDVTSALTAPSVSDAEKAARQRRANLAIPAASDDVETKRLLAGRTAQIAMSATSDRAQKMDAATEAMLNWKEARGYMLDLYGTAGLKEPERLEPILPAACVPSKRPVLDEKDPTKWQRGFAARVYDPAAGMSFSGIKVAFTFADGVVEERVTNYSGFAILPLRAGIQVKQLTVTFHSEGEPIAETFPITPAASGIQHVGVNSRAIIAAPFSTLRLKIDGQDLVSAQMHDGHYVRQ